MVWKCPRCSFSCDTYNGFATHYGWKHDGGSLTPLAAVRRDELKRLYVDEQMSENQTADELGVSRDAVKNALRALNVDRRGQSEAEKVKNEKMTEEERREQTEDAREELPDGGYTQVLWDEQCDEQMEVAQEAAHLGADSREENGMAGVTGQEHPNWNGGKSIYDAVKKQLGDESWQTTRARIREQQNGECALCGSCIGTLDVHHIVPLMAGGCNADELLMGLCPPCHNRAEAFVQFEAVLVE